MSKTVHSLKLVPYNSVDLDKLSFASGDVVYDVTNGTIRLMNGITVGGSKVATQPWVAGQLLGAKVTVSDTAPASNTNGNLWFSSATGTLYVYYNGVYIQPAAIAYGSPPVNSFTGGTVAGATTFSSTVSITGQIRSQAAAVGNAIAFYFANQTQFPTASSYHGAIVHSHADGRMYMAHSGVWQPQANLTDIVTTLAGLTDVSTTGATNGQVLNYNSSMGMWMPATVSGGGGGGITLSNLSVTTAVASATSSLTYNSGTGVFTFTPSSVTAYSLPTATTSVLGGVKIDGSTITISGGVITANYTAYSLPAATTTVLGGIKIDGSTLAFNGNGQLYYTGAGVGGYTLPTASTSQLGGVRVDGSTITISGGVITANYTSYSLPTATTSVLGGVKVDGTTVTINGSGVISAMTSYTLPTATTSVLGGVKIDGSTITINGSGVISSSASAITTYPAITRLDVTNNGSTAYLFSNQYSGNNPTVYAISGTTIAFNLNVSGHPFLIRQSGVNFDIGLIHVSTTGVVSTGTSAQGQQTGTLYWQIPQANAGAFAYQCSIHAGMVGVITIKQISSLP